MSYCEEAAHRKDYIEEMSSAATAAFFSVLIKTDQNHLGFWDARLKASNTTGKQSFPRPENYPNTIKSYPFLSKGFSRKYINVYVTQANCRLCSRSTQSETEHNETPLPRSLQGPTAYFSQ